MTNTKAPAHRMDNLFNAAVEEEKFAKENGASKDRLAELAHIRSTIWTLRSDDMEGLITEHKPQFNREQHGSLWDRGSADAYYERAPNPHWYPNGSYKGEPVTDLSKEEKDEYFKGYSNDSI